MKTVRNIAVLGVLAALSGGLLAWLADATEAAVRENRQAAQARVVRELTGAATDVGAQGDILFCEPGLVVLRGTGRGYGGALAVAVAVGGDGRVTAVRVLEHGETPGFADILAPGAAWLEGFGRGEAHAVTGATVTSQAVLAAVARVAARVEREACWR